MSNNVDPSEIAKFNGMAARWWDPEGDFKPLHDMNPLRVSYIDSIVRVNGKSLLDVGCGGGILTEHMAKLGAKVTGIDLSDAPLSVAKLHAQASNVDVEYQSIAVEELAVQRPASYDVVTCLEMLEHVPDPSSVIGACAELCKPGGQLFFSTINRNPKSYLMAILGAEYVLKLLPRGTHEYQKFIRPSELGAWIRDARLLQKDTKGVLYNPFSKKFSLSETDCDVNYMVHAVKPR